MEKNFILIELLAVIVILAIIAVIAIVLNIIKDTKKSPNKRSAESHIKSLELSLTNKQLNETNLSNGFYSIDEIKENVKITSDGIFQIVAI